MTTTRAPMSEAEIDAICRKVSNWGRWGPEDERGALNPITPELVAQSAATIRDGVTVSCAWPLAVKPAADNPTPVQHAILQGGDLRPHPVWGPRFGVSTDYFAVASHGSAVTHLDALCHLWVDGKMYNGFDQSEVRTDGAHRNSITSGEDGIAGRGVLLDIPALKGEQWLEPGTPIVLDDLLAAEHKFGVRVQPGDLLLVRTGRDTRKHVRGPWSLYEGVPGLHANCLEFLHERGVAVLGSDGGSDVVPSSVEGWVVPIHYATIVFMGVHLIDNMDLSRLADACRERNRWSFHLTLAPLRLDRGTTSPVNPIALF